MSEIPSLFAVRPIIERHHKAAMYHPFVEAMALTLVDVPITFIILLLYSIVLYFLVGLQRSAGQFLCVNMFPSMHLLTHDFGNSIFFLFEFATGLLGKAVFRTLAAAFKSEAPAQALAGILVMVLSLYSEYYTAGKLRSTSSWILLAGYIIPQPSMIGALRWITWINASNLPTLHAHKLKESISRSDTHLNR